MSRATVYRRLAETQRPPRRRPGPQGPMDDARLLANVRQMIETSPFHGEGYRKVWARLRFAGVRTSQRRVLRLMRENSLLAPHRLRKVRVRAHAGTITTSRVDTRWGTDMTETVTLKDGVARVFVAVDHCNTECVGIHAARSGNRFEALEPVRQGALKKFGVIEQGVAEGLSLRHDHGSNYMSQDFQEEISFLGMESSPAFVREPEGNGVAERFIRTLKENLLWVRTFETIEELRLALLAFKAWYNDNWLLKRHGYLTPSQVRQRQRPENMLLAA